MDSERRRAVDALKVAGSALLLALAATAAWAQQGAPRWLALCALLALLALAWGGSALRRLQRAPTRAPTPEFAGRDTAALQRRLALLESQLELLPVALWQQRGGAAVEPLNAAARRLLAPGGADDTAALQAQLAGVSGSHALLHVDAERGQERWLLAARRLNLAGAEQRLLAMLPVESALEAETLRAWRQLVHVLTHEIMNSLTPIASLSRSAQDMQGDPERAQDLALALDTVARRAEALVRFVSDYRRVSEWPEPRPEPVELQALFARLEQLVAGGWRARGGQARFQVQPGSLSLMADPGQLEQALLNLMKNAAEATAELAKPSLEVQARLARGGRLAISVRDNGPGVPPGLEQQIFMPFFSARSHAGGGAGSGIGLAVVRNLVHGMGGTVRYVKQPAGGACFVLSF